ncbi:MAG: BMC domain-containing protein [Deltaproteobacteria bacterium]|nr:BMC domain-containing protein [Deltaproteobacteria bacterium]
MEKQSLGLIETWGFVPAIEAADVGAKAANVILLEYQVVPVGRVVITFIGDVAAVTAAVSAGAAAARKLGQVLAVHVIPRPDRQVRFRMPSPPPTPEPPPVEEPEPATESDLLSEPEEQDITEESQSPQLLEQEMADKAPESSRHRKKKPDKQESQGPQDEQEETENADS